MIGKPYFTLNGSESQGWRLMMYRNVIEKAHDGTETELDSVTVAWRDAKEFPKLKDALAELCLHEEVESHDEA